ncbi:hypothetical protein B0H16DRAFT_1487362 [Mycena metata]|uniref:Uncharacterized protein n=1 Tax=Mycena metata TaxID=1033252 RepID=A0AAD7DD76_9AGAR|nr:hypothetical protein B0H16DRAFT_1487362 [Mycena metata]
MSSVPLTQTSDLLAKLHSILPPALGRRMEPSLRSLWVSQIRNLCQGMHESIGGRIFTEFPAPLQKEMRTDPHRRLPRSRWKATPPIPRSTMCQVLAPLFFAMTEQFVMLCGFEGDEDAPSRESMFRALALLQYAMVIHPDYASTPVEAPGYSSAHVDPFFYGVGTRTKERQIAEARENGHLLHQFGENLLRYNRVLGSRAYQPPNCPPEERIPANSTPAFSARRLEE